MPLYKGMRKSRLWVILKDRGWTQATAAAEFGMKEWRLHELCNGADPTPEEAAVICERLGGLDEIQVFQALTFS